MRAGAVVHVEVGRHPRVLGLERHGVGIAEVLLHVRLRAQQALLLAGPQRQADGAAQPQAGGLEDAHRLHHRRRSGGVVGGAGARVPGVEVRAEHHHFGGLVGAGQLGDDVERVERVADEAVLHVQLEPHRHLALDEPDDPVVLLRRRRRAAASSSAGSRSDTWPARCARGSRRDCCVPCPARAWPPRPLARRTA